MRGHAITRTAELMVKRVHAEDWDAGMQKPTDFTQHRGNSDDCGKDRRVGSYHGTMIGSVSVDRAPARATAPHTEDGSDCMHALDTHHLLERRKKCM